ncbi:leukotriene-A4 hydrolase [Fomitiporia mediterranea MF3/22]|uniref:leukotriene-A4 hydrolase n=1 Tax=Fomitiporia mediterranea (strain MF3/22) TaxID=694068 RepID=UPI0004408D76|nr:leukotriene-A4 hydrolase [Fomitiporia mediterranea MF3/22]EJD04499.1 leukotriene-A4 hydrolase [Fomitiporia mediterranea MF3/22]
MADPATQSNYLSIATQHVALDWTLDFNQKIISGSATHRLTIIDEEVKEVVFDSGGLDIISTEVAGNEVLFKLDERHLVMGSALHIPFSEPIHKGANVEVKITYKTAADAVALQFLDKEYQTQGKKFPYLFSQCQPIYARTMAPLQDTPSLKITYSAKVTSVLPVLMSAIRVSPPPQGPPHDGKVIGKDVVTYSYNQPTPIPSYLIAIASGDVRFRPFPRERGKDWTSGIWAEPELIDAAYWEFSADTNRFLAAEEKIVVPYKFGVYDLLVLPPSFPYGGMENACLSFLTPTLLTGDRTLVDVVVHELTHSWFGNGVTHTHASHFWLNEGWTTYIERLLQQVLHSPAHRGFSYLIGYKALLRSLEEFATRPRYQRMVIDFEKGEDPDDAYSRVPYEKGSNLLLHLERVLGGLDVFLPYIRDYVNTFMGKSIDTDTWKKHLYAYWSKRDSSKVEVLDRVDWNGWFFGEGLTLPVEMEYDTTLAQQAYELAARWDSSRDKDVSTLDFKSSDLENFDTNQKIVFLERLQIYPPLPPSHLTHLSTLYSLRSTQNTEIRYRFYELALLHPEASPENAKIIAQEAAKWIVGEDGSGVLKGRMKFCRPVFRAVSRADEEVARSVFGRWRGAFHPIARRLIEKVRMFFLFTYEY